MDQSGALQQEKQAEHGHYAAYPDQYVSHLPNLARSRACRTDPYRITEPVRLVVSVMLDGKVDSGVPEALSATAP